MTKFFSGTLETQLAEYDMKVKRGMVAAANFVAPQAEQIMKSEAPWTDRTGAARNGLGARVVVGDDRVSIVLYHSVAYGVFLELRWGGKFAIIEPTLAATGPLFMQALKRLAFD